MVCRRIPRLILLLVAVGLLAVPGPASAQEPDATPRFSILVFSKTDSTRHKSIASGTQALQRLGTKHNFRVDTTAATSVFTPDRLASYEAVVFLNTSGDVMNEAQERAFEAYVRDGHGFIGIHAAATTEPDWNWYGELVGARVGNQTSVQEATVNVSDPVHPATRSLPVPWTRADAWYNYRPNPRGAVHVLATLDEQSYDGGTMGSDHPISWAHNYDGGRSFYTGIGHTKESYSDPQFRTHLLEGIEWAAGVAEGSAAATVNSSYEKVVLDSTTTDPMDLDVAPDGRVFYIERRGVLRIWDPNTQSRTLAGYLPVSITQEDGLMGLALAPSFAETGWVYLYYTPVEGPPRNQLSRFTVEGNHLDLKSEIEILRVPTQRKQCCHTGGSITFGPEGKTLYLSTGDDTNPFASSGYAPIDEREDRKYWDAQRTAANTQDLRGKILRINPQPDGSYTIPDGNLFADPERGRPEIYTMGLRNPYRITVDDETGWLYWGDIGPDAAAPDSARGPAGHDEFNQARAAGNYGWPYFVGDNKAYHEYDFAADTSGLPFNPTEPVNDSPNNSGSRVLPPAQPPMIWYPYGPSEKFPEMGVGSRSAMVGPVYHHSADSVGPHGLPAYFDDSLIIYEWGRNWIKEVTFDSTGHPAAINPLFTDKTFIRPMDVEVGPNGRLYILQWGNNFSGGPNSQIVRLDYYGSPERPPVAAASVSSPTGSVPRTVTFRADTSQEKSESLAYAWDFNGDGTPDRHGAKVTRTFDRPGTYTAQLTVATPNGRSATDEVAAVVGNSTPSVSIDWPLPGGIAPFDTPIPYRVTVSDPEDETIAEDRIAVESFLGRDSHELPLHIQSGATGTVEISRTGHYDPKERIFAALEARYTDGGAPEADSLQGRAHIELHPRHMEAELAPSVEGAQQETLQHEHTDQSRQVLTLKDGHHLAYPAVNLRNIDALTFQVAPMAGGRIEVRRDGPNGPLLAKTTVPTAPQNTTTADSAAAERDYSSVGTTDGDWQSIKVSVSDSTGTQALYLVVRGVDDAPLLRLDGFRFEGPGMTHAPASMEE